ncbi:MAG: hypothetical protein IKS85_00465 [Lachnospiraceae bacterium]|nr:hypothetical protein [Lachnospiraceae bacterium]
MREYLRLEKIAFHYMPVFYLTRLLFAALVLSLGYAQGFVMLFAATFSVGFVHQTEEERLIPLSEEELKRKRLTRVIMIEIRYAALGILGYCLAYFFAPYPELWIYRIIMLKPLACLAFFVMQMGVIFANLLDAVFQLNPLWKAKSLFRFFFFGIPQIVFFVFTMSAIGVFSDKTPFICDIPDIVSLILFLGMAVLVTIYCVKTVRDWKMADFRVDRKKGR